MRMSWNRLRSTAPKRASALWKCMHSTKKRSKHLTVVNKPGHTKSVELLIEEFHTLKADTSNSNQRRLIMNLHFNEIKVTGSERQTSLGRDFGHPQWRDSPADPPAGACTRWWPGGPSTWRPRPAPRWLAGATGRADGCRSPRWHSPGWRWCWDAPRDTGDTQ